MFIELYSQAQNLHLSLVKTNIRLHMNQWTLIPYVTFF